MATPRVVDFTGRVAVVTGGRGTLGAAIGHALAEVGAQVHCVDIVPVTDAASGGPIQHEADVRDEASLRAVRAAIDGPVTLLVNAHGLQKARSGIMDCSEAVWTELIDVNLNGVYRSCRVFGADMAEHGGAIVNVGSVNGVVVSGRGIPYGVAKAGVSFLTKALALELAPRARVNCIAPTAVESGMTRDLFADPGYVRSKQASIPLQRFGTAEDIVSAVMYLLSDSSGLVTGHTLVMDGGLSLA
jgi:NAD(P)-dependent dehydrogenase (short-subunit alcohol dehydrogenase family)